MKRIITVFILTAIAMHSQGQDKVLQEIKEQAEKSLEPDTTHKSGWRRGGLVSIGLGQGASKNWAAGAEASSFSISGTANLFANLIDGKFNWRNTLDLGYALVNTSSIGTRKTDDKLDFFSKLTSDISPTLSIGGVANFRTQFSKGYDYNYLGKGLRRLTSSFMAPAYAILAPGIDWHPQPYFSVFLSPIGGRFVIVSKNAKSYLYNNGLIPDSVAVPGQSRFETPLAVLYGVDPARKVRAEVGGFASVNFVKELFKNFTYKSRLDLYSNYLGTYRYTVTGPDQLVVTKESSKPQNIDVFWTNLIVMKVNRFLNVSYNLDMIYDDDVKQFGPRNDSPGTQLRSQLTVGVAMNF